MSESDAFANKHLDANSSPAPSAETLPTIETPAANPPDSAAGAHDEATPGRSSATGVSWKLESPEIQFLEPRPQFWQSRELVYRGCAVNSAIMSLIALASSWFSGMAVFPAMIGIVTGSFGVRSKAPSLGVRCDSAEPRGVWVDAHQSGRSCGALTAEEDFALIDEVK